MKKRTFIPGSEWLYYKIYCGAKTSDIILTTIIGPLVKQLESELLIINWFFIRFSDPENHIRLRFHVTNNNALFRIFHLFYLSMEKPVQQRIVYNIQIDTYKRELERYGEFTIEYSEELFHRNSQLVLQMLCEIHEMEDEKVRWRFALLTIDQLLKDFKLGLEKKMNLMEGLKTNFGIEFGMNRGLKSQIDKKFRTERTLITNTLLNSYFENDVMKPLQALLMENSKLSQDRIQMILQFNDDNKLEKGLFDFLASHIHMSCNRIFRSKQRVYELVIYDFLYRHYKSEWAKKILKKNG